MGLKPDYIVRAPSVVEGEEKWSDIGVAFENSSGVISTRLDALPLGNKIVLIPMKEEE